MKTLFLPFRESWETPDQRESIKYSASSRIRCDYVSKYWGDSWIWNGDPDTLQGFDAYIFQKIFSPKFLELAQQMKNAGKLIIFDLCDAEWERQDDRRNWLAKMIRLSDYVTCSTEYIRVYVTKNYHKPAYRIPDRLDLDEFPKVKDHNNNHPLRVGWFGNRNTIYQLNSMNESLYLANKDIAFTLVLISDQFDGYKPIEGEGGFPIEKRIWKLETANEDVLSCDVIVNPHDMETETGRAKSDNKTITSWALGIPVVSHGNPHRIQTLITNFLRHPELRKEVGKVGREMVEQLFDAKISALEYKFVIKEALWQSKTN